MGVSIKIPGRGPGTGPILPTPLHSAGVANPLHRFAAERLTAGDFTTWADAGSGGSSLARAEGAAGSIDVRAESGLKFVRLANTPGAPATLVTPTDTSALLTGRAYTVAMVARKPVAAGTDHMAHFAGVRMSRPANGSLQVATVGTGASGAQALAAGLTLDAWHLLIAESSDTGIARINSTEVASTATWTPGTGGGYDALSIYAASPASANTLDVAELIIWPKALTANERAAVRTALKARYSVLS